MLLHLVYLGDDLFAPGFHSPQDSVVERLDLIFGQRRVAAGGIAAGVQGALLYLAQRALIDIQLHFRIGQGVAQLGQIFHVLALIGRKVIGIKQVFDVASRCW